MGLEATVRCQPGSTAPAERRHRSHRCAAGEFIPSRNRRAWLRSQLPNQTITFAEICNEHTIREMLIAHCDAHTRECISAFLFYKPASMVKYLLWVYGVVKLQPDMHLFVSDSPEISRAVEQHFTQATAQLDKTSAPVRRACRLPRIRSARRAEHSAVGQRRNRRGFRFPIARD